MKKLFAVVALVAAMFVAGNVQAQMSVNLGYAPETIKTTMGNYSNSESYQGFFAGITYNVGIVKDFNVAAGAQFRMNFNKESETALGATLTAKSTQILIDVPVLLNYRIAINRDIAVTPFVGPMFTIAASGKTKYTGESILGDSETTYDWYKDNEDYSRFNLNGVCGVAFGYTDFKLFAGYRMGLLDLEKDKDITVKTNGIFVGLGMNF